MSNIRSLKGVFILFLLNFSFSQVDNLGDQSFSFEKDGQVISIPVFSNKDIQNPGNDISRIIILIHGQNRNADDYFDAINEVASDHDLLLETMILVPQFLITEDLDYWQLDNSVAFWTSTTAWQSGNRSHSTSEHPRDFEISSFAVTDSIIAHYASTINNLQDIVVVGKSAGGQYTNRYSGGSDQDHNGIIRYVIISGSSYLYFDEFRPTDFLYPINWMIPSSCNGYDDYKYGLQDLNGYMSLADIDSIISRYHRRDIQYLIGSEDDGGTSDCRAMVQGDDRYERAILYHNHLRKYFGQQILNNHKIAVLDGIGHDTNQIFNSNCFKKAVFDLSNCNQLETIIFPEAQFSVTTTSGPYPLTSALINETLMGTYPIQQLDWNVNGELVQSNGNINFVFDFPGHYGIELIATDLIGLSDTIAYQSIVQVDTMYGDTDFDTQIALGDVDLIMRSLVGEEALTNLQEGVGDVSGDNSLSSFDGSILLQHIGGTIETLPLISMENFYAEGTLFSPNSITASEGEILTIPLSLAEATNVYSFLIELEYDNSFLQSGTIYSSEIVEQGFTIESTIMDSGSIIIAGASAEPFSGTEILSYLYFLPTNFDEENYSIRCTNFMLNESAINQEFTIVINQDLDIDTELTSGKFNLGDNFPNPFNSSTRITFDTPPGDYMRIYISDIKGRLVKLLFEGVSVKGTTYVDWDGTNENGFNARSGVYFYTLQTNLINQSKKMSFVR